MENVGGHATDFQSGLSLGFDLLSSSFIQAIALQILLWALAYCPTDRFICSLDSDVLLTD